MDYNNEIKFLKFKYELQSPPKLSDQNPLSSYSYSSELFKDNHLSKPQSYNSEYIKSNN